MVSKELEKQSLNYNKHEREVYNLENLYKSNKYDENSNQPILKTLINLHENKIKMENNEKQIKEILIYNKNKTSTGNKGEGDSNKKSSIPTPDNEIYKLNSDNKNNEDNVFKQYLVSKPIFKKDRDKLRPSYIPPKLPHRDREINQLASILVTGIKGGRPSNVFIYGKTGTGKTAVVKYLEKEMQKLKIQSKIEYLQQNPKELKSDEINKPDVFSNYYENSKKNGYLDVNFKIRPIYINCKIVDTQYGVLANIGNRFIEKFNERIPFTGWPTEKVYEELKNRIINNGGLITIILDEIDKLVSKSGDEVLYILSRINTELEESGNGDAKVSLIGISNYLNFMELLDPRVKSSLGEEEIIFHPYNATQLENILQQRANLAFEEGVLSTGVIQMCASFAAQEHGDARKALELLRIAGELAEREKAPKVLEKHVRNAQNKIELNRVNEVIRTLPTHSKIVLLGIILSEEKGNRKLMTGEVYDIYKDLCRGTNLSHLTQRRVADLISELDMLGIITALLISKGRYGRTREIQLSVPLNDTKKILVEDELLNSISTHKLRIQTRL